MNALSSEFCPSSLLRVEGPSESSRARGQPELVSESFPNQWFVELDLQVAEERSERIPKTRLLAPLFRC